MPRHSRWRRVYASCTADGAQSSSHIDISPPHPGSKCPCQCQVPFLVRLIVLPYSLSRCQGLSRSIFASMSFASTSTFLPMTCRRCSRTTGLAPLGPIRRRYQSTSAAPNYPGHEPLSYAQNALLAVGSGIVGVLDTTRGGVLLLVPPLPSEPSSPCYVVPDRGMKC